MKPGNDTMDTAAMRIFRDLLVTRAGGRLSLATLREEWSATHFRRGDLDDTLARLQQRGLLLAVATEEGPHYELTAGGAHHITDIPHEVHSVLHRLCSALQLAGTDHRHPSPPGTAHDRRAEDRV